MATSFKRDHWAECRRDDGKTRKEHPFRADACALQCFREAETLADFVAICGTDGREFRLEIHYERIEIDFLQDSIERLRADSSTEHGAVLHRKCVICGFIQDGAFADGLDIFLRLRRQVFETDLLIRSR